MSQLLLSVNGLMMRFGGLLAVNNVNLDLHKKEIVSLIGPNGAGKTTVFNCLTGFYKPTGGTIMLKDKYSASGYAVTVEEPRSGKDWNEYLQKRNTPERGR